MDPFLSQGPSHRETAGAKDPMPHSPFGAHPNDLFDQMATNPMMNYGLSAGRDFMQNRMQAYIPGVSAFWSALKYYFNVDNQFVIRKTRLLVFPYREQEWARRRSDVGGSGMMGMPDASPTAQQASTFLPPASDVNAPDLYIPLMSFVTFVLAVGLTRGTRMQFTPEVLSTASSSLLLTHTLEVLGVWLALYLTRAPSMPLLDIVAFTGYKYFTLCLNTLVMLSLGNTAYWVCFCVTAPALFVFTFRSLAPALSSHDAVGVAGHMDSGTTQRNYLKLGIAAVQVLLTLWLGMSA